MAMKIEMATTKSSPFSKNKKLLENSPLAKGSKEMTKRLFTKRKCSRSLMTMFELESSSALSECDSYSSLVTIPESPNSEMGFQLNKRFKAMHTAGNATPKAVDENNSHISLPPDWDDTAARSSFDSPFVPKESLNKRISHVYPVDFSQLNSKNPTRNKNSSPEVVKYSSTNLPKDVRLGTKLRLVSEKAFPWLQNISTPATYPVNVYIAPSDFEEAMEFTRYVDLQDLATLNLARKVENPTSSLALLQSAALYHQFPTIGPVQLFPRTNADSKSALKGANLQSIGVDFMDELRRHWLDAFDFLFHNWLSGRRKSFYLCSPQFTVLFTKQPKNSQKTPLKTPRKVDNTTPNKLTRKESGLKGSANKRKNGASPKKMAQESPFLKWAKSPPRTQSPVKDVQSTQEHLIVLTPTTSGLRQILQKNGVRFSLTYKTEFVDLSQEECPKDFMSCEGDDTTQMDHDEWLKNIGISPKSTLKLRRSASEVDTLKADGNSSSSSNRPEFSAKCGSPPSEASRSTVLIRGKTAANSLYQLLVSQPQLINTKTGPQSGLPPTLISHAPFRHSKQNELTMNSQLIKKGAEIKYVLEMEQGPILPTAVDMVLEFVRTMPAPNQIHLQIVGRNQSNGMNEALNKTRKDDGQFANINDLESSCGTDYKFT